MTKLVLWDIDGPILPANPDQDVPYMKRLTLLRQLIDGERYKLGYPPIEGNRNLQESFDKRTTTDIGMVMTCLHPDFDPFFYSDDLYNRGLELIRRSVEYYKELVWDPTLKYQTNPGVNEFMNVLKANQYTFEIVSGNPYGIARDKLERAGVLEYFLNPPHYAFFYSKYEHGDTWRFRDELVSSYLRVYRVDQAIYIGDRISDVGLVARTPNLQGIIIPSFRRELLDPTVKEELVTSRKVLFLDNFATPADRERAIQFMEGYSDNKERLGSQKEQFRI